MMCRRWFAAPPFGCHSFGAVNMQRLRSKRNFGYFSTGGFRKKKVSVTLPSLLLPLSPLHKLVWRLGYEGERCRAKPQVMEVKLKCRGKKG